MAQITDVANAIFKFKNDWIYNSNGDKITDDDKETFFFIFNRYFSKTYPDKAQLLNYKNIDKVMAMDIWFHFMKSQPYPNNFWSKTPKVEKEIPEKEYKLLHYLISNKGIVCSRNQIIEDVPVNSFDRYSFFYIYIP